jgi:CheY-like chemotaxis protein
MNGCKILIIEDEGMIAMMVEDMVTGLGHQVAAVAGDLEKGLEAIEKETFDIALLDVNLNGRPSYPIAAALFRRKVPFLLTTGYGVGIDEEWRKHPILQKPFTEQQLGRALQGLAAPLG